MLRSARTAGRARCRRHPLRSLRGDLDLLERALAWRFVRPPPNETGPVAEPTAADMIVANLHDEFRSQRLPLAGALGTPPAGAARCVAGEAGRHDKPFELPGQRLAVEVVQCRGKPDVVELAFAVVEAEQQRPDQARVPLVGNPPTTQSAVRRFLTLSMARSPGW